MGKNPDLLEKIVIGKTDMYVPELVDPLCLHIAVAGQSRTPRWSEGVTS
jgi:hypothetical protein